MKKNSGFTIMELMVVIAIIAILAGITIPNLIRMRSGHQLNSAARQVQSSLQAIRLRAVKENSITRLVFNNNTQYQTEVDIRSGAGAATPVLNNLPPGITGSINIANVTYNSRGLPNQGGTITLNNTAGRTMQIVIPFTGSPVIQ